MFNLLFPIDVGLVYLISSGPHTRRLSLEAQLKMAFLISGTMKRCSIFLIHGFIIDNYVFLLTDTKCLYWKGWKEERRIEDAQRPSWFIFSACWSQVQPLSSFFFILSENTMLSNTYSLTSKHLDMMLQGQSGWFPLECSWSMDHYQRLWWWWKYWWGRDPSGNLFSLSSPLYFLFLFISCSWYYFSPYSMVNSYGEWATWSIGQKRRW